ncbi:hypothetical protein B0H65DRAFT_40727 [Neurospora tetraspora]|uniref:Uncharacterized protein n=1 Tax=Neurospora tetraspora TaxID=94610 RepID=A0AAE0JPT3_9PEZI|nr:hypothetical protein B0H65DRAFT_40727 [Neurospora tetraspora]
MPLIVKSRFGRSPRHLDTLNLSAIDGEDQLRWRASSENSSHGYNRYYLNGMTRRPALPRSWAKLPLGARRCYDWSVRMHYTMVTCVLVLLVGTIQSYLPLALDRSYNRRPSACFLVLLPSLESSVINGFDYLAMSIRVNLFTKLQAFTSGV